MLYGWRVIRAMLVGLVLAAVAAWLLWPVPMSSLSPEWRSIFWRLLPIPALAVFVVFIWLWAALAATLGQLVLPPIASRLFRALVTAPPKVQVLVMALWGLGAGSLLLWATATGLLRLWHVFFHKDAPPTSESFAELQTAGWLVVRMIAPVLVFAFPIWVVRKLETIREHPVFLRWFKQHRGGSARWAGPATYDRVWDSPLLQFNEGILGANTGCQLKGVYLGRTLFSDDFAPRHVVIQDDGHMLTIGQPGSGKSVTAIWPNLAMYAGSAIVIDPKGEHAKAFLGRRQDFRHTNVENSWRNTRNDLEAKQRNAQPWSEHEREQWGRYNAELREAGTDVRNLTKARFHVGRAYVLDPFNANGVYPSARYNPLSEIDINSANARKLISAVSASCVVPTHGENRFWEEAARAMIDGAIAHVLTRYPREQHTLPAVADLLLGRDPETGIVSVDGFAELVAQMSGNDAAGGLPQVAAAMIADLGEKAYGNVTAELRLALKWATDPAMRIHLAASDFSFAGVGEKTTTVFIALPFGNMVEQMRWLRTIAEVSMRILEDRSEASKKENGRVLYILDELPQYGAHLKCIKEGMVTLRSAGVKLWAFVQNLQQLTDCFGEDGAKNFQSGGTVQVFGVSDDATAEWVARKIGGHRILDRKGLIRRKVVDHREADLVSAAAVEQELRKTANIQYVFSSHGPPMRLERMAFKPLSLEGNRFRGLLLEGHYDG